MTWTKLDDHADEHPKIEGLSDPAFRLWLAGLIYCNRNLTDGVIPKARAVRLTASATQEAISEILSAVLWHETPDAYLVHDFLDFNPSKADVEARRAGVRERTQRWREPKTGDASQTASQPEHVADIVTGIRSQLRGKETA